VIWSYVHKNAATRAEYFQLFLICLFPIQAWGLVNLFYSFPSLMLEMTTWQLASVIAYVFTFALFESVVVFALLFLLSLAIPRRFFSARLVATGTALVLCASAAAILNHLYFIWKIKGDAVQYWNAGWIAVGVIAAGLMIWSAWRHPRLEKALLSGAERLALLSLLYFSLDVIGVVIVLSRNLL
jgi:hypothetical protein